jgi:hypothetical protein
MNRRIRAKHESRREFFRLNKTNFYFSFTVHDEVQSVAAAICILVRGLVVMILGLAARRFAGSLPLFITTYAGDTLGPC